MRRSRQLTAILALVLAGAAAGNRPAVSAQSAPVAIDTTIASAALLSQLPDGEQKRRFMLDCTGCHQLHGGIAAPGGAPRSEGSWTEAIARMLGFAGASTGFPICRRAATP